MLGTVTSQVKDKVIKSFSFVTKGKECQGFVNIVKENKPLFVLLISSTETTLIPGISAAGQNIEQLKLTPALDAEFLVLGKDEWKKKLPISPSGVPSPVILSKAMVDLLGLEVMVIDVGAFTKPECKHLDLNMGQAKSLVTGSALTLVQTSFLFQKGEKLANNFSKYPYVVIGECVPGGTTTALSLLCALGLNAFEMVSSSFPQGNSLLKTQIVKDALLDNAHLFGQIKKIPLKAAQFFGDGVQVFLSGLIKGAQKLNVKIMLAGGSQMLAIYYLSKVILDYHPHDTVVATTSWVTNDKNAKTKKLAELVGAPLISSNVNFKESKYKGLYAYEEGHIKEGVGAGGLMVVADFYKGCSQEEIVKEIEKVYALATPLAF